VNGNFEVLREGFDSCDCNLKRVPRWMAISKPSEKDSNDVTAICLESQVDSNFEALGEGFE
jgi:hypothetical protein